MKAKISNIKQTLQVENGAESAGMFTSQRLKLGLSFSAFILIGANDGAVGVLLPSIMKQYQVHEATVSLLFLASAFGYLIASFNIGLLMEKVGNWQTLLLGMTLLIISTGMLIFQPPFAALLGAFFLVGMGVAIIDPGLNIYIAALPRNTALLNYLHGFYGIGAWLGPVIASIFLALHFGWNSVYMLWFAVSLCFLAGFGIVFRDWQLPQSGDKEQGQESSLSIVLKLRYVWIAALFLLFYVGGEITVGNWCYSLLTRERHGAAFLSGWIVSGYWLGLTLGRLLLGSASKQIGDKRMLQFCLLGVIIGLLITWFIPIETFAAIGLFLTGFSLGPIFPTTIAVMSRILPSRILASAIGFMVSLGSMGAALFPWIMGNLAQHIGLWSLLPFCIFIALVQLGLWISLQTPRIAHTPTLEENTNP